MIVSQSELDSFHQFASRAIAERGEISFEDLVSQWHAALDRDETIASVRRGVADCEAGRVRSISEVDAEIRGKLGLPERRQ